MNLKIIESTKKVIGYYLDIRSQKPIAAVAKTVITKPITIEFLRPSLSSIAPAIGAKIKAETSKAL